MYVRLRTIYTQRNKLDARRDLNIDSYKKNKKQKKKKKEKEKKRGKGWGGGGVWIILRISFGN